MQVTFLGIKFPFQKGPNSLPDYAIDAADIQQSVIRCVMVMRGERVMRPDVGSDAMKFVFENNNDLLSALIQAEVLTSISKYEPRVQVRSVNVQRLTQAIGSSIVTTITYVILANGSFNTATVTVPSPTS
jgi:phage baseplate assembly protein W